MEIRPDLYGESFADVYDEWYAEVTDAEATAALVADRCGAGPVLELGVGTGRLVEPMVAYGLDVVGLDASTAMLARCAARGLDAELVQADMAVLPFAEQTFGAALIAFNTLFNLATAEAQQTLFHELGRVIRPDGVVVVEALVASTLADGPDRAIDVRSATDDGLTVVATVVDAVGQTIDGQHLDIGPTGVTFRPWMLRWSTPSQIDIFASNAGFELVERYQDWSRQPFDQTSETHVSTYRNSAPDETSTAQTSSRR